MREATRSVCFAVLVSVCACGQVASNSGSGVPDDGGGGRAATGGAGGAIAKDASVFDAAGGAGASTSDASNDGTEQDVAPPEPPPCPEPSAPPDGGGAPPSCSTGLTCACGLGCCERRFVPGGWFPMGRSLDGSDAFAYGKDFELPEHPVHVSDFYLDAFEVTVARFRHFVEQYPANLPQSGDGAHPEIADSGWHAEWNALMPATRDELEQELICEGEPLTEGFPTWTAAPAELEEHPINCMNWYEAFAFCIWDGARLPTEAEWEYTAAGGDENRRYPWGADYSFGDGESWWLGMAHACIVRKCFGTTPSTWGMSRWGQFALGGSVDEWTFDPLEPYPNAPCGDCAVLMDSVGVRGGGWHDWDGSEWICAACVRSAARAAMERWRRADTVGFRCARSP